MIKLWNLCDYAIKKKMEMEKSLLFNMYDMQYK